MLQAEGLEGLLLAKGLSRGEAAGKAKVFAQLSQRLSKTAAGPNAYCWFVPGRLEFLGKHTDYAGGRSLLAALEKGFCVAAAPRTDDVVRVFDLQDSNFSAKFGRDITASGWGNYAATVMRRISRNFPGKLVGADIFFSSDLPPEAGMSSSSALMVSVFLALRAVNSLDSRPEYKASIKGPFDAASYAATIENGRTFGQLEGEAGVGTFGGSEDHTTILHAKAGCLSQFSFCPPRLEDEVPMPEGYTFAIGCSGVRAAKTGNAKNKYNDLSFQINTLLGIWHRGTGRSDTTLNAALASSGEAFEILASLVSKEGDGIDHRKLLSRLEQFSLESRVIIPAVSRALSAARMEEVGELVDRSQMLAENALCNQLPETIHLQRSARRLGAAAASAFGAGFGGSVWAAVKKMEAEEFLEQWKASYLTAFPAYSGSAEFFCSGAGPAAFSVLSAG